MSGTFIEVGVLLVIGGVIFVVGHCYGYVKGYEEAEQIEETFQEAVQNILSKK